MSSAADAFKALKVIAQGAERHALPLPAREEAREYWRGLGFHIGATRLVAPMADVIEVMGMPAMTPVPGARRWLRGVANVRGRLVPVVDLCRFAKVERTTPREQWRVFVIDSGDTLCGLLVEHSFGMLQFEQSDYETSDAGDETQELAPFLQGAFRHSGRIWRVVDMRRLVREPQFFDVAA